MPDGTNRVMFEIGLLTLDPVDARSAGKLAAVTGDGVIAAAELLRGRPVAAA